MVITYLALTTQTMLKEVVCLYYREINYDLICLTETYLDSTVDPNNLLINDHNLFRAAHPDNVKRGGVCLYYGEKLTLQLVDTPYIEQCILCEINIQTTIGYVAVIYRSPSQSSNEFAEFLVNFDKLLNQINMLKSSFTVILGDLKARSQSWWSDDITSYEGSHIDCLTTTYGFHQLISVPTHLLPNSSSCIDLIFTDQPNLAADGGVHPTLHGNCHHQIIFSKFNLMTEYPPPYEQLVWDYKKANIDSILKAFEKIDWTFLFSNKSVYQQVKILNNTLMNVFPNFTPNKSVTFNDKDPP